MSNDHEDYDDRVEFSVFDLLVVGGRMAGGYGEDDAIEDFLKLHPDAKEADVRAELERELEKSGWYDDEPHSIGSTPKPDLVRYSVLELYTLGKRFEPDYSIDDAVMHYCWVHSGTKDAEVRAELTRELAKLARDGK